MLLTYREPVFSKLIDTQGQGNNLEICDNWVIRELDMLTECVYVVVVRMQRQMILMKSLAMIRKTYTLICSFTVCIIQMPA